MTNPIDLSVLSALRFLGAHESPVRSSDVIRYVVGPLAHWSRKQRPIVESIGDLVDRGVIRRDCWAGLHLV